jgi:hypothetical protein
MNERTSIEIIIRLDVDTATARALGGYPGDRDTPPIDGLDLVVTNAVTDAETLILEALAEYKLAGSLALGSIRYPQPERQQESAL